MGKEEIINNWLRLCGVDSMDKLTDKQCCYLYDGLYYLGCSESVVDCYKDRNNEKERKDFAKVVRKCLKSELRIIVYRLTNEGVIYDEKSDEYFKHRFGYIVE